MDGGMDGQGPKGKNPAGKIAGIVAAVVVLAVLALNSTYEIKEQEQKSTSMKLKSDVIIRDSSSSTSSFSEL